MDGKRDAEGSELFGALVDRLRANPRFMAHVLADYQQRLALDDEALARTLGTRPEMIVRLALCTCPDVKGASFDHDLRELATYTEADEQVLSQVIRSYAGGQGIAVRAPSESRIATPAAEAPRPRTRNTRAPGPFLRGRALAVVCSLSLLLALGGLLLSQQSRETSTPDLVSLGPRGDQQPADSSNAAPADPVSSSLIPRAVIPSRVRHLGRGGSSTTRRGGGKTTFINLDRGSTLRSADEPRRRKEKIVELSRTQARLLLRLPRGLSPGRYAVRLLDGDLAPVFSTTAGSQGKVLVALVDTRGISAGDYWLCVARESGGQQMPDCVPVRIVDARADRGETR